MGVYGKVGNCSPTETVYISMIRNGFKTPYEAAKRSDEAKIDRLIALKT